MSDIAVAYGLDTNRDGTKDELLPAILAAEQSGRFQRPPKDPYRLTKASKNADEWRTWRENGLPMPAFEEPDVERYANGTYQALQTKASRLGLNPLHKTKAQIEAMIAEVENPEK